MPTTRATALAEAMQRRQLIRFSRRFESGHIRGYVLDVGPRFFLVAMVSDRIWFDGFECFRIGDVKNIVPDPYATFAEAALKIRREKLPKKPRISIASIEDLLLSAARAFPLVTIHRERIDPEVCWIGCVREVNGGFLKLLEIGPDAAWDCTPHEYRVREITRVTFGGEYEEALHVVGGGPPVASCA